MSCGLGRAYSPHSWVWPVCLNSALLENASLHPVSLPPATSLHGSHSTGQLCFQRQTQAVCMGGLLPGLLHCSPQCPQSRFAGSVSCHSALCGRSFVAMTDARAAKCIELSESHLPATLTLLSSQGSYTSRGLGWGSGGKWEGQEAEVQKPSHLSASCTVGNVWMGSMRSTVGQRAFQVPSPSPVPLVWHQDLPNPLLSSSPTPPHAVPRGGHEVAV